MQAPYVDGDVRDALNVVRQIDSSRVSRLAESARASFSLLTRKREAKRASAEGSCARGDGERTNGGGLFRENLGSLR